MDSFPVEDVQDVKVDVIQRISFERGRAALNMYTWGRPYAGISTQNAYFFHLCLTPRPRPAQAAYLDTDRQILGPVGRIVFIPPGHMVRHRPVSAAR